MPIFSYEKGCADLGQQHKKCLNMIIRQPNLNMHKGITAYLGNLVERNIYISETFLSKKSHSLCVSTSLHAWSPLLVTCTNSTSKKGDLPH